MIDPLTEVVLLLQPGAPTSKIVSGAGQWTVRRQQFDRPFFCVVLEGRCRLEGDDHATMTLHSGDFVLIPSPRGFVMSGMGPALDNNADENAVSFLHGEVRHGAELGPPDVRMLVGYCVFGSPDAALLVSLLPKLVLVHGEGRLATLLQLVVDESRASRPARDVILARLIEVLLIEALRATGSHDASPGLLRGLADERLATAIRRMHERPTHAWTVAELAKEASLSRSAFFERFGRAVGIAPMEYLLAWRMALAKNMLGRKEGRVADVAERVGYGSASAFSVAFTRYVGVSPTTFAREYVRPTAP